MFRFTRKPSSGSHSQYLAKITHLVQCGYIDLVQDVVSVMAAYYDLWGVCAVQTVCHWREPMSHTAQFPAIGKNNMVGARNQPEAALAPITWWSLKDVQ